MSTEHEPKRPPLANQPFHFAVGTGDVLVTTGYNKAVTSFGATKDVQIGQTTHKVAKWGANDNAPSERQRLVYDNNVVGQSLKTSRNAILGNATSERGILGTGVVPYYRKKDKVTGKIEKVILLESDLDPKIIDLFHTSDYSTQLLLASGDLTLNAQFVPEYARDAGTQVRSSQAITSVKTQRALYMRSGATTVTGNAANWFLNGGWGTTGFKAEQTTVIPYYNPDPKVIQPSFVKRYGDPFLTDNEYYLPTWEGSRWWIELANLIPQYHIANLKKGWFPRWHIEIPFGFFDDPKKYPYLDSLTDEEYKKYEAFIKGERTKFEGDIKGALAGYENASGVIFSDYQLDEIKSKLPIGVKITALKAEIHHDAYTKLFEASNTAIISGQGMSPEIAGVQMGNRLSGANYREALQLFQILQLPVLQNLILDAFFRFPARLNDWKYDGYPIEWMIENVSLLTQDVSKTGDTQPVDNQ